MHSVPGNPARNTLPSGITPDMLTGALRASGYPLQIEIAAILHEDFVVAEEWGYLDRDTDEHRSLDVFALRDYTVEVDPYAYPQIVVLVEAKRSGHPYVFFQSPILARSRAVPRVAGRTGIHVRDLEDNRVASVAAEEVLGPETLHLVAEGPEPCASFSKVVPKGKSVELSGTDPYNQLMLPLVKATDFAVEIIEKGYDRDDVIPTALVIPVAVLDAPLIVVPHSQMGEPKPVLAPWVRIVRREAVRRRGSLRFRLYTIEVVHAAYLRSFVRDVLLPSGDQFSKHVIERRPFLQGQGVVPTLRDWNWQDLRLQ